MAAHRVDLSVADAAADVIAATQPTVVVQAASFQTGNVISQQGNAWSRLVAEGGLSATAVLQAPLSNAVAHAMKAARPQAHFINCCFADVVNPLIAALDLPIACGVGNVAILSNAFAGTLPGRVSLKVLAHSARTSAPGGSRPRRAPGAARGCGSTTRRSRTFTRSSHASNSRASRRSKSPGASGVPLMQAMAAKRDWAGHVPGPHGLPGGYPVRLRGGKLELDLPSGLTRDDAIAWNLSYEQESGLVVSTDGQATYTGRLRELLALQSPALAAGFHVRDLHEVYRAR